MTESVPPITLDTFDLASVERHLCTEALRVAGGSINVAAKMLGITRHALRRRMTKYRIRSAGPDRWRRLAARLDRSIVQGCRVERGPSSGTPPTE